MPRTWIVTIYKPIKLFELKNKIPTTEVTFKETISRIEHSYDMVIHRIIILEHDAPSLRDACDEFLSFQALTLRYIATKWLIFLKCELYTKSKLTRIKVC